MSEPKLTARKSVFLVDDHPLVREWLTNLINQQQDLVVCGEAEDAPQALRAIEALKPDVVIADITLASGSGIELVKDIKRCVPSVAIVVLTTKRSTRSALYGPAPAGM
jgi:DNA-binding NarL/FixJ family response regulator